MHSFVETFISGQDSYLPFYVKIARDEKLTALTNNEQITRLSWLIIPSDGYVMITYYKKGKMKFYRSQSPFRALNDRKEWRYQSWVSDILDNESLEIPCSQKNFTIIIEK